MTNKRKDMTPEELLELLANNLGEEVEEVEDGIYSINLDHLSEEEATETFNEFFKMIREAMPDAEMKVTEMSIEDFNRMIEGEEPESEKFDLTDLSDKMNAANYFPTGSKKLQ